jgi:hypothetical protein
MGHDDCVVLKSGRRIYANHGIIGITAVGNWLDGTRLSEGYDSPIFLSDGDVPYFTKEELIELSQIMIDRWNEFKRMLQLITEKAYLKDICKL